MPRFINVTLGCDWEDCTNVGAEGEDAVIERTIALDKKAEKTFLICKQHNDQLDEILIPLLTSGVKVENGTKNGKKETCKICGRPMKNRAGMAQHVIRSHGFESLEAYEAAHTSEN